MDGDENEEDDWSFSLARDLIDGYNDRGNRFRFGYIEITVVDAQPVAVTMSNRKRESPGSRARHLQPP